MTEQLRARIARTDLGLALAHRSLGPGERLTCEAIAAWCDCSQENIEGIEKRAIKKLARLLKKAGVNRTSLRSLVPDQSGDAARKQPVESV